MDHKVSKDMISSGMIPSGEKTQADLGRIQYGSAPSPSSLMDAYKSIYEHHQKDKDGNTIPHEGEELNEIISPMVQLGARKLASTAAKRGIGTAVKKAAGMAAKPLAGKTGLKAVGMAAKTLSKPGVRQGLKKAAGTAAKVGAIGATGYALGRAAQDKPSSGFNSYQNLDFGYTPDGDTLSEDLFDALKSALIEEGCDEKNAMKIMASVTPDYLNEIIQEENIDEVVFTGTAMLGGLLAKKLLGAAAFKGLKTGATMLAKKAAVKTMGMGARPVLKTIAKKGVGAGMDKAAGMAIKGGVKSAVKNPINTAVAGSMVMPPAKPKPEAAQRAVTSGKRTAGMQRMDLDLFDIVKGQLLDEGLTEEEVLDVMTTLTIDEIKEGLMPTTFKGALVRGAVGAAGGVLAKKGLDKAKEASNDAINKARDSLKGFGGNTRPGSDKMYFGK